MTGIGEILRSTREKAGLTLTDVSLGTYIREGYLAALEREEFDAFSGNVYLKGMLQNYGDFLGLSGIGLVDRWNEAYGKEEKPEVRNAEPVARKRYMEHPQRVESLGHKRIRRRTRRGWNSTEWAIVIIAFCIIVALFTWIFW